MISANGFEIKSHENPLITLYLNYRKIINRTQQFSVTSKFLKSKGKPSEEKKPRLDCKKTDFRFSFALALTLVSLTLYQNHHSEESKLSF